MQMEGYPIPELVLSDEQIQNFIEYGFIHFDAGFAAKWIDEAFVRLGCDPNDPSTWEKDIVHMSSEDWVTASEFTPKAWGAMCQLLGGEERVRRNRWGNGFVVNFSLGADREWMPPSPAVGGWHKDGNYFYHYLDSPEQELLLIVIWKDIQHQASGTFIACDSIKPVAQYLLEHREGIHPSTVDFGQLITQCKNFREITGKAGDVVLMHPYMLHASSQNPSGIVRFMTNPSVTLREPINFNRDQPEDYSPVEKAVLHALDVERLNFHIEGERRHLNERSHQRNRRWKKQRR